MSIIMESFRLAASNSDILSAPSRLAAIPAQGVMTIQVSITHADVTNFGQITLQLPNGEIPFEDLDVPVGLRAADASMDTDLSLVFKFPVNQGGHVLFSYVEAGTVVLMFSLVTLEF